MAQINWYPGHMAKAIRQMETDIKMVDCVCEILDARIPFSSSNPELDRLASGKPRLVILNRADQADSTVTDMWRRHFEGLGRNVLVTDSKSGRGVDKLNTAVRELLESKIKAFADKGQSGRTMRIMVFGIPNVGKSSFINRAADRKAAEAANKPGVTRGKQWIKIGSDLELMDTPGVLWPKLESREIAENLAIAGAIKSDVLDISDLSLALLNRMLPHHTDVLNTRYSTKITPDMPALEALESIAAARGCRIKGGEYDYDRASSMIVDDFRNGKLGKISLEVPQREGKETDS